MSDLGMGKDKRMEDIILKECDEMMEYWSKLAQSDSPVDISFR